MSDKNYFEVLNSIDVNSKVEKKNGLSYLSWSYAWGEVKKIHPDANYKIYETAEGINYFTDGRTCWVKCGVTIKDIEHIEYLPIMDFRNKSIPLNAVTSFDVNKAIQRCVTKAIARHGLGLYIYSGEDLPEDAESAPQTSQKPVKQPTAPKTATVKCSQCGDEIKAFSWVDKEGNNRTTSAESIIKASTAKYGKALCMDCINEMKAQKEATNE